MNDQLGNQAIRRVIVGTDRSEPADRAVHWAAGFANRYDAGLLTVGLVIDLLRGH